MDELILREAAGSRSSRKCVSRNGGMGLIEVLIAMLILAGGLLTMATAQIHAMSGGQRGRHLSQAAALAESQMEQLQRQRWTSIPVQGWTAATAAASVVQTDSGNVNEIVYMLSYRINSGTPGKTRGIDVRVNWTEPAGLGRSVSLSGIRHNREAL